MSKITLPAAQAARVAQLSRRRLKLLVAALRTMASELGYVLPTQAERASLKEELAEALQRWRDTQAAAPVKVTRQSSRSRRLWDLCIRIEKRVADIEENETQTRALRLARLSPAAYDRVKREEADKLGINLGTLNGLVGAARADIAAAESEALVVPWANPVDGAALLYDLATAIRRYVVMSDHEALAVALWILHCWAIDAFSISPRLLLKSPTKRSGKTTLRDVLACVVPKALSSDNASTAAIFRATDRRQPTLLLDEADTWVRRDQQVRGIINSGHRRGGYVMRMDRGAERLFRTFGPMMLALIGRAADTIEDRSIAIHLQRRRADEPREPFSLGKTAHLEDLARRARRWASDHIAALSVANPVVVETLGDRAADNWRPLLAIADEAGLGARARQAAKHIAALEIADTTDPIERLIVDIHTVLTVTGIERVSSMTLAKMLAGIEGGPWAEWRGTRPISKNQLAWMLNEKLKIKSASIRFGKDTAKGYYLAQFADAFARYVSQPPNNPTKIGTSAQQPIAAPTQSRANAADIFGCADVPIHNGKDAPHA